MSNPVSVASERRCFLALGSNLGNRLGNLQAALRALLPAVQLQAVSALYESGPVGPEGQPPYYNAVLAGFTSLEPIPLLDYVKKIEWQMGRRPSARWSPRPLDIDILLLDGVTLATPRLTIPHPRLTERGFVLTPLADLEPARVLPGGLSVATAAARVGTVGLRRLAGPEWTTAVSVGEPGTRPLIQT